MYTHTHIYICNTKIFYFNCRSHLSSIHFLDKHVVIGSDSERRREEKIPSAKTSIDLEVSLDFTHSNCIKPQAGSKTKGAVYNHIHLHIPF